MTRFRFNPYSRTNQLIVDGFIFASAFAAAYALRFEGLPPWQHSKQFLLWLPYLLAARLLVNWKLGIYRFIWRYVSLSDAVAISRSLSVVTLFLLALRLFYPSWALFAVRIRIPLSVIAGEYLLSLIGCLGTRALRRILYERQSATSSNEEKKSRVLLIGAGTAGVRVAREIASRAGVKLVGFLDDDPEKLDTLIDGMQVLGPLNSLPSVVNEYGVDQVIICITRLPQATVKQLWQLCDQVAVQIKIIPTLEEILHGKVNMAAFRDVQMADLLGRGTVESLDSATEVTATYRGKRILITGAGGSIGSELAHQLIALVPEQVLLLDKDENSLNDVYLQLETGSGGTVVHPVVADIRFPERLRAIFSRFRPQVVFHAAAHKHVPLMEMNPCEAILNNITGTHNLVELCLGFGVSQFVFISTDKAVRPASVMGASKRVCEMIIQARCHSGSTRFACVRFGNVLGSRGSVIPLFQKQIARGGPVTVTHRDARRFLMTIGEAVCLVIQAGTIGSSGEVFVLDMGNQIPILDLAHDLIELSGLRSDKDIKVEITQLRPGEKIVEELFDSATETLSRTRFDKIHVVQGRPFDLAAFTEKLTALEDTARHETPNEVRQILMELNIGYDPEPIEQAGLEETQSGKPEGVHGRRGQNAKT